MKVIVSMLTGIMLLLIGIFLLLIGAEGAAVFFAIAGVIAFVLGAVEGLYGVYGGVGSNPVGTTYARIAQKTCPNCGEKHDADCVRCPYCDHNHNE